MPHNPIVYGNDVGVKVPVLECYKTIGSCVRCAFIKIWNSLLVDMHVMLYFIHYWFCFQLWQCSLWHVIRIWHGAWTKRRGAVAWASKWNLVSAWIVSCFLDLFIFCHLVMCGEEADADDSQPSSSCVTGFHIEEVIIRSTCTCIMWQYCQDL